MAGGELEGPGYKQFLLEQDKAAALRARQEGELAHRLQTGREVGTALPQSMEEFDVMEADRDRRTQEQARLDGEAVARDAATGVVRARQEQELARRIQTGQEIGRPLPQSLEEFDQVEADRVQQAADTGQYWTDYQASDAAMRQEQQAQKAADQAEEARMRQDSANYWKQMQPHLRETEEQRAAQEAEIAEAIKIPETPAETFDRLSRDKLDLERQARDNFAIGNFAAEGGQFLIDQFSAEAFANAVQAVYNDPDKDLSMHAVIQQLVPIASHRQALYDQMDRAADQAAEEFEDKQLELTHGGDDAAAADFQKKYGHEFGPSGNIARLQHFHISDYRNLDRLARAGLAGLAKRLSRFAGGSLGRTEATTGVLNAGTLEPAQFARELHEQDNSLAALYAAHETAIDEGREKFRAEARALSDKLSQELDTQRQALEADAAVRLAEYKSQLLAYFDQATIFEGRELATEQADPILAELETRAATYEAQLKESVKTQLQPLEEQLARAQGL